jgi:hypothetical protein
VVYFGVFGEKEYHDWAMIDSDLGAAKIPCRWCVGDGKPNGKCAACKNTREMWIGV